MALDAFVDAGRGAGASAVELDELIDGTNRRVADKVLSWPTRPSSRSGHSHHRRLALPGAHRRHAIDIGEQTEFVVTGEFHEFSDASH